MISIRDKNAHYEFPKSIPLTKKLADLLENDVDEKYFLSEKLITCFTDMSDRHGLIRGLRFKPKYMNEADYAFAITIVHRDKSIEFIFNSGYKVKVEARK